MAAVRSNIQSSVGSVQLCGNQIAGCEAAIHAMKEMFKDEGAQGVLLVEANIPLLTPEWWRLCTDIRTA